MVVSVGLLIGRDKRRIQEGRAREREREREREKQKSKESVCYVIRNVNCILFPVPLWLKAG